ncbi:uncharacterized protein FA14DRAFT_119399 [Meira miltonrushii]|uniref:Uncharacterized protein n=1 Tax=Meira miltonrushii TaxID=1280837 RepID=A0A316VIW1_9BASI|nr:uncharacterized protein FA14DRAFT_119399 [Meira miltonrushii]PWN36998.1 hypothetical protein FA14DRAFT_119399 [Meira miltonrushii]
MAAGSSSSTRIARPGTPRSLSSGLTRTNLQNSGPNLVSVKPSGTVTFEALYINHAPGVQKIHIVNISEEQQVLLRLSSTLGRALAFLKPKRSQMETREPITYPTNTAKWASEKGLHPSRLRDLRHLVSNLEPAESLILEPKQGLDIFLTFRPVELEKNVSLLAPPRSPTPGHSEEVHGTQSTVMGAPVSNITNPLDSAASSQSSTSGLHGSSNASPQSAPDIAQTVPVDVQHQFIHMAEVLGSVTIRASPLATSTGEETLNANAFLSSNASNFSSNSSSRPPSFYSSHISSATSAPTSDGLAVGDEIQVIQIPFYASSCRPQLSVTRHRHHGRSVHQSASGAINLDFGDLFVGQKEELDLHIHNLSEIDIHWQARFDDADNMLGTPPVTILDDQGNVIEAVTSGDDIAYKPNVLNELTTRRIRVSVEPHETCRNYEQVITFTNLHNASNTFRVVVRANMLAEARDDALAILSGNILDFGDCAGGHWTRQLLILKNNCEQFLDVHFAVEKGVEADFQLAELAQRGDEDDEERIFQEEPPLLSDMQSMESSSIGTFSESGGSDGRSRNRRSPSLSSENLLQHNETAAAIQAAESARTPTSYAQNPDKKDEPPYLALSSHENKEKKNCLGGKDGSLDDVDASSVASQAGSAPGSPTRAEPVKLSNDIVLEPAPSSHPYVSKSSGSTLGEVHSEVNSSNEGGDRRFPSRPSSMLFSTRPNSSRGRFSQPRTHDGILDDAASVKSDVTAVSHDSRIGPFLSSASHASSSHHHPNSGGGTALRGLRGNEQGHGNQIEELILRPGAEHRVIVSHRPTRGEIDDEYTNGRLQEKTFNIMLDYAKLKSSGAKSGGGRERKTVSCKTRTCTSFVTISPKVIDFGMANVGTRKSANFVVQNHSELTARVDLRFVSKVISMYRDEIAVPPLQSIELRVDFFPRRVNESYRKQVTVANLLNRSNDQILEVRSSNVDEQRISFHSLFYRILTSTGSNFIDFGDVNINCTRVRTFGIENVSSAPLSLELSAANTEDLKLYIKSDRQKATSDSPRKASRSKSKQQAEAAEGTGKQNENVQNDKSESTTVATTKEKESYADSAHNKSSKRTAHLKERFLESMSQDVPASVRNENSSWRIAQKQSHFSKKGNGTAKNGEKADKKDVVKKTNINMVAAMKKGGKGRLVQKYGKSMTFKDRTILSNFEHLDLATGPPVDGKRIPAKSKKWQTLDSLETVRTTASSKRKATATSTGADSANTKATKEGTDEDNASASHAPDSMHSTPLTPARRLPAALANDIKQAGSQQLAAEEATRNQSPALTGKRKVAPMLHDAIDVSKLSLDELLAAVEGQSSSLSTFFFGNSRAEEQSVRTEVNLQRELKNAITEGRLLPVDLLALQPGEEKQVVAIYTPNGSTRPHIQGNARKQDSRIFIRLADFSADRLASAAASSTSAENQFSDLLKLDREELPIRDLIVKSNLCRSLLELSQPHINFGYVQKGETKTRKIVIQNRSEWALRYCIRKSGSIASGDIKLKSADRYGVVPGHGKREVEFVFCPSLTGAFQEKLIVENVADRDRDETVLIKANVTRVSNFSVEPTSVTFGSQDNDGKPLAIGTLTNPAQSFAISNLSNKSRSFVLRADKDDLKYGAYHVEVIVSTSNAQEDGMKANLTKAEEEEVEHISQKLKIATRKGHTDKVQKYETRLTELGVPIPKSTTNDQPSKENEQGSSHLKEEPLQLDGGESAINSVSLAALTHVVPSVTINLPAQQSKRLLVRIRPSCVLKPDAEHHYHLQPLDLRIPIQVHEVKNIDEVQVVELRARVQASAEVLASSNKVSEPILLPSKEEGLAIFSSQVSEVPSAEDTTSSDPSPSQSQDVVNEAEKSTI